MMGTLISLLVNLAVISAGPLVHRPHGIRSLSDSTSLFQAIDLYGLSCQRNEGGNEEFATLWHPLSMRKFINQHTGTLTALKYGEHDESQHYTSNDENTDFTRLSLDFISPAVCAVKCQISVGTIRYTNMISLLKTASDQPSEEQSSAWKIVQELSSSMVLSDTPSGCLLPPLSNPGDVNSNRRFGPQDVEEVNDMPQKQTHSPFPSRTRPPTPLNSHTTTVFTYLPSHTPTPYIRPLLPTHLFIHQGRHCKDLSSSYRIPNRQSFVGRIHDAKLHARFYCSLQCRSCFRLVSHIVRR